MLSYTICKSWSVLGTDKYNKKRIRNENNKGNIWKEGIATGPQDTDGVIPSATPGQLLQSVASSVFYTALAPPLPSPLKFLLPSSLELSLVIRPVAHPVLSMRVVVGVDLMPSRCYHNSSCRSFAMRVPLAYRSDDFPLEGDIALRYGRVQVVISTAGSGRVHRGTQGAHFEDVKRSVISTSDNQCDSGPPWCLPNNLLRYHSNVTQVLTPRLGPSRPYVGLSEERLLEYALSQSTNVCFVNITRSVVPTYVKPPLASIPTY